MELGLIDTTEDYSRHDALAFAVQLAQGRGSGVDEVIEAAEIFLNWLNGVTVN